MGKDQFLQWLGISAILGLFVGIVFAVHTIFSRTDGCKLRCIEKGYTESKVSHGKNICYCDLESKSTFKNVGDL